MKLTGDIANATTITVFAPKSISDLSWNGNSLSFTSAGSGIFTAELNAAAQFTLPDLGGWKYTDGLPEIQSNYSATSDAWVGKLPVHMAVYAWEYFANMSDATNTNTSNPTVPALNNPVLYVDDYHIHTGVHIYRATFATTSEPPTGVFLDITGGTAFGYSAWLNGDFIGSWLGLSWIDSEASTFLFDNATLNADGGDDNVLVVVMDNSGHDQRSAAVNPRGITNATLVGPGSTYAFAAWQIAGTAGREDLLDPVRGPLNEGGLHAERVGVHLPGYPADDLADLDNDDDDDATNTLSVPGAGVRVFRTVVPLSVPAGLDVSVSFRLSAPGDDAFGSAASNGTNQLRALLFVNGYQYGRFNPYIGNQIDFPVPPGVLDYDGDNTIAVTVWSQSADGAVLSIDWNVEYVHATSYDFLFDGDYLRPNWTEERLGWA